MKPISERHHVDRAIFENEIVPAYEPVVLRGLVDTWPAVAAGRESPQHIAHYLCSFNSLRELETWVAGPEIKGRFFYGNTTRQFNFERKKDTLPNAVGRLMHYLDHPNPPALYSGSVPIAQCLPDFLRHHQNPVLDNVITPNLWLGNQTQVSAHYDLSDNIACVVAGQRQFTLFPPEQVANLYVGPLDNTIAGQPVSMVNLDAPDFQQYPLFKQALATASTAILEPGDAIYIPSLWWHNVKSLSPFNLLVNYWWDPSAINTGSPFECLAHALLTIRSLPAERRAAWRTLFDHYVFNADDKTVAHLHPDERGPQADMTPELAKYIQSFLANVFVNRVKQN